MSEIKARSIEYLGDAMQMHGEHGCCRCCFGRDRQPTPATGKGVPDHEWAIFLDALRTVARGGIVHQDDVRPLIRGRIHHKHIGLAYKRAKAEGLLTLVAREQSGDRAGRNTHHLSPVYALAGAA